MCSISQRVAEMLFADWRKAALADLPLKFFGCDMSSVAIQHARANARRAEVPVDFFEADVLQTALPAGFDVVMCSLFLHHLTEEQALNLIRDMSDKAGCMILISDLLRSRSGLLLAQIGT